MCECVYQFCEATLRIPHTSSLPASRIGSQIGLNTRQASDFWQNHTKVIASKGRESYLTNRFHIGLKSYMPPSRALLRIYLDHVIRRPSALSVGPKRVVRRAFAEAPLSAITRFAWNPSSEPERIVSKVPRSERMWRSQLKPERNQVYERETILIHHDRCNSVVSVDNWVRHNDQYAGPGKHARSRRL